MTEPKTARSLPHTAPNPLFLRDQELTRGVELLDFAYRALTAEPDRILGGLGLGRNHRRVIHFVARQPGITLADLVDIVRLTKQSLSRTIKELEAKGLIARGASQRDRRRRPLRLTEHGAELEERLNGGLRRRLALAYRAAGADAVAGYHQVLLGLVDERARRHIMGAG
ncbi:MAG: MarR family winged helix-turn-helix transcriptional regulator [Geminicoccaceae bacterium]